MYFWTLPVDLDGREIVPPRRYYIAESTDPRGVGVRRAVIVGKLADQEYPATTYRVHFAVDLEPDWRMHRQDQQSPVVHRTLEFQRLRGVVGKTWEEARTGDLVEGWLRLS